MKHYVLIPVFLALSACASYDAHQHAEKLRTAAQDDQVCRGKGLKFPEDPYVTCRMQLQDDRIHQDWLNLQVMRQSQRQPQNVPAPAVPREFYRPLDPDHFTCLLTTEEDKREYIICDETDEPEKP